MIFATFIDSNEFEKLMSAYIKYTQDNNSTFLALKNYFKCTDTYECTACVPFSPERKYSSVTLDNGQSLVIGAPEKLCKDIPNGIAVFVCCAILLVLSRYSGIESTQSSLLMYLSVGFISLAGVIKASLPFNLLRGFLALSSVLGFIFAVALFSNLLQLPQLSLTGTVILLPITAIGIILALCIKLPRLKTVG